MIRSHTANDQNIMIGFVADTQNTKTEQRKAKQTKKEKYVIKESNLQI